MTSNKTFACMYLGNKIHSQTDKPSARKTGLEMMAHQGDRLAMHSHRAPDVAEYQAWLDSLPSERARHNLPTAAKLRRMVIARREGCTLKECGDAIGRSYATVCTLLSRLPKEISA